MTENKKPAELRFIFGPFSLDIAARELRRAGQRVPLTTKAFDTLAVLVRQAGCVVEKADLMRIVWPDTSVEEATLTQNIFTLRKALGEDYIETVARRGYRFARTVRREAHGRGNTFKQVLAPAFAAALIVLIAAFILRNSLRQPKPTMLAILPFSNLDPDPRQQYFSDGLTEEIITELGRAGRKGLGVIARTSVMRYRDTRLPISQIARELRVDYLVEGSIRKAESKVRITVQLIRAKDQTQVWARGYDSDLGSLLQVEREAASQVAQEVLLHTIGRSSDSRIDVAAHESYLRGRSAWNQRTETSLEDAISFFKHAIERQPSYVAAHAALADAYAAQVYSNFVAPTGGFSDARAEINEALRLDPQSAEALASKGYLEMYFDWNFKAAEQDLRSAIALNPNYATAHDWLGVLLTAQERFDESRAELARAQRLDPLSPPILTDIGFELHYSKRNRDAIESLRSALVLNPRFPLAHFWLGRVYSTQGQCTEALAEFAQFSTPEWQPLVAAQGQTYGRCGMREAALASLATFRKLAQSRYVTSYGVALVNAGLGDKDAALFWLRKALDERSHWLVWLRLDPRFDGIREDPRFGEILRRVFAR